MKLIKVWTVLEKVVLKWILEPLPCVTFILFHIKNCCVWILKWYCGTRNREQSFKMLANKRDLKFVEFHLWVNFFRSANCSVILCDALFNFLLCTFHHGNVPKYNNIKVAFTLFTYLYIEPFFPQWKSSKNVYYTWNPFVLDSCPSSACKQMHKICPTW